MLNLPPSTFLYHPINYFHSCRRYFIFSSSVFLYFPSSMYIRLLSPLLFLRHLRPLSQNFFFYYYYFISRFQKSVRVTTYFRLKSFSKLNSSFVIRQSRLLHYIITLMVVDLLQLCVPRDRYFFPNIKILFQLFKNKNFKLIVVQGFGFNYVLFWMLPYLEVNLKLNLSPKYYKRKYLHFVY